MKKGKHTEEQITGVLKQVEAGHTVKDVARELGVSEATISFKKTAGASMKRPSMSSLSRRAGCHGYKIWWASVLLVLNTSVVQRCATAQQFGIPHTGGIRQHLL
jgi:Transposase